MPLNVISGGGGMPFLRFSIDDNEWGMSSQQGGDLIPIDWDSPVLIDVERIDMGWLRLMGGRDFQEWPRDDNGIHQPTENQDPIISKHFGSCSTHPSSSKMNPCGSCHRIGLGF